MEIFSDLVVGSEDFDDLVRNDCLDVRTAVGEILTGIKMIRMLDVVLSDAGGHAETKVGVDVDLADSALPEHRQHPSARRHFR